MRTPMTRRTALFTAAALLGAASPIGAASTDSTGAAGLRFELYKDSRGRYRWRLKSGNGQVVATSGDGYSAKAGCRDGIALVMNGAASATVEDLT